MNTRTIKKKLKQKHEDFVSSIEDEKIRDYLNNDTMITGGCIASMLLNEKVNDYDYYFRSFEAAKEVAAYFVNKFIDLNPKSDKTLPTLVTEDNKRVRIKIQSAGIVGENSDTEEYEYFEQGPEEEGEEYIEKAIEEVSEADEIDGETLDQELPPYRPVYLTDNAITLSDNVQLIIRFFGSARDIHSNFDFVHCKNWYSPKENRLYFHKKSLESLLTKELKYIGSKYPVCSVFRLRKFLKRGWHINAGEILKILLQVSELDLTNIETLEDQLTGVDTAYFQELIWILKKQEEYYKDADVDYKPEVGYVATLVDRIFS